MIKVKIQIENDKGLKSEIEISDSDNLTKMIIIQNVFNLFGISNDVLEMAKTFNKIGEAYSEFFTEVEPIEHEAGKIKNFNIVQELSEALVQNKEELESTYKSTSDQPDFIVTGIKTKDDGTKLYRLHYKCPACWNRGTHYVYENSTKTWCHRCQHEMTVYLATPDPFPKQDTFGNYFRAGDYKDSNINWK